MINDKNLKQEGGEKSTNLQGQNVNVYNGISYSDARDIALDVFKANFLELSQNAATLAKERAEHLVDEFLNKMGESKPNKIDRIQDPDMQYALFSAQKEYARSGEKDLEDMLVSILMERIEENTHSLKKIVLNEALEIAPKLTDQQLDILTIVFLIQDTRNSKVNNKESLKNYIEIYFTPFLKNLTKEKSCYKHLEYSGCCGTVGLAEDNLSQYFLKNYKGVFSKGFDKEEFKSLTNRNEKLYSILIPCLNNSDLFQFNALTEEILRETIVEKMNESEQVFIQLKGLFNKSTMNVSEANDHLTSIVPSIKELIDTWKNSYMCAMNPTTVGTALAYINLKRKAGIELNLGIWIK